MNKTIRTILQAISYIISLIFGNGKDENVKK